VVVILGFGRGTKPNGASSCGCTLLLLVTRASRRSFRNCTMAVIVADPFLHRRGTHLI